MRSLWMMLLVGCASPGSVASQDLSLPGAGGDLSAASHDLATARDLSEADRPPMCSTLGTPDHCGSCGNSCPPGMDTAGTQRTCSDATAFATCDFICKGEYYDVDGKTSNGCEAQDLPLQDTVATAVMVALPDVYNVDLGVSGNPSNIVSQVYGDGRVHDMAPTSRPTGREDWYQLVVTGGGASDRGLTACLSILGFPVDDVFEVCLSGQGATSFLPTGCKTMVLPSSGNTDRCVQQAQAADESGTYYVRVRKISGAWTANQYALYLEH